MATFETPSYIGPSLNTQGFPGVIDRTVVVNLATLTGDASYAFIADDIVKLFKVPKNAKILYFRIERDVIDDGTATLELDLVLTDGVTPFVLFDASADFTGVSTFWEGGTHSSIHSNSGVEGGATVQIAEDIVGKVVTGNGDYDLRLLCTTGSNGDAATDAEIIVSLGYTCALEGYEGIRDFPSPNP